MGERYIFPVRTHTSRSIIGLAASFLIAALIPPGWCEAGWQHKIVGGKTAVGFSSIAVGPDGNVHYFFAEVDSSSFVSHLVHLTINRTGAIIRKEQLEPQAGIGQVAVDSSNHLHLVSEGLSGLEYGFFDGSAWSYQPIPFACSNRPNIALDSGDHPLIACVLDSGGLDLLSFDGTTWSSQSATTLGSVAAPTVAAANDGTIHIGFISDPSCNGCGTVIDAVGVSGGWTLNSTGQFGTTNIESFGPSTAVDSQNLPGIVYDTGHGGLSYTHFDGSAWNSEVVNSNVADYSNVVFAPGDVPSLITILQGSGAETIAKYAQRIGGEWKLQTIGNGPMLRFPRLAVDSVGIPFAGADAAMAGVPIYAFLTEPAVSLESLSVESTAKAGKTILSGGLKLMNLGTGADGNFKLTYFLSDTAKLSGGAIMLGSTLEAPPSINHARGVKFKLSSPASPSGMYLIAQIAPAHASESAIAVNGGLLAAQIP